MKSAALCCSHPVSSLAASTGTNYDKPQIVLHWNHRTETALTYWYSEKQWWLIFNLEKVIKILYLRVCFLFTGETLLLLFDDKETISVSRRPLPRACKINFPFPISIMIYLVHLKKTHTHFNVFEGCWCNSRNYLVKSPVCREDLERPSSD